ncbi:putative transcription factor C2H2 family [Helianthus annuus]|uniref:Transcription factor C2H2 family n=2 Tax=Helianthus annuus TaxID=4232 RepID=A0A9K3DWF6_HELAN|nr:putative transcription factor C2H2 family [Helianthus annuus]KAJ0439891.1 putative transcription factor C2H2 family [Helianthus annuus]KAJ0642690.1 putative transcription factor C2H2 family [Helianthus annuus]KAJ0646561.1 putative transcription factor C2H2 family [Helianthus annuus]KAJ0823277.1 putative transcription factor C2H2 family [Helianthus annuus]
MYVFIYKEDKSNNLTYHFPTTSLLKVFPKSGMSTYLVQMVTSLRWAWDFTTRLSFFQQRVQQLQAAENKLSVTQLHKNTSSMEVVECAVCLSKIEEDDEIRVLRCDHLFHKDCLDRCVEYKHTTCPLCRDFLSAPRMVCELGRELLVFSFCSNNNRSRVDDFDRWWIR